MVSYWRGGRDRGNPAPRQFSLEIPWSPKSGGGSVIGGNACGAECCSAGTATDSDSIAGAVSGGCWY